MSWRARAERIFGSELPLADHCGLFGWRPPRIVFFAVSGSLCNVAQLGLDRLLLLLLHWADIHDQWWLPSLCWTASYSLSISVRHASHSVIVFGMQDDSTWYALGKTYLTYLSTILASTGLNLVLVGFLQQSHDVALMLTAGFSVLWSYVALKHSWIHDGGDGGSDGNFGYQPVVANASVSPNAPRCGCIEGSPAASSSADCAHACEAAAEGAGLGGRGAAHVPMWVRCRSLPEGQAHGSGSEDDLNHSESQSQSDDASTDEDEGLPLQRGQA